MNRQQIFSRIGRQSHVIYSNGAFHSWEVRSEQFKKAKCKSSTVLNNAVEVYTPSKRHIRFTRWPKLDRVALKRFGADIVSYLNAESADVLYIFHPQFSDYANHIPHKQLVYHAYDDFSLQGGRDDERDAQEAQLVKKADVVFASSKAIQEKLKTKYGRENIVFLPNGVDYESFSEKKHPVPEDLETIPDPRVGYVGAINRKVDFKLFLYLAERLRDCSFVLVGPVKDLNEEDQSDVDLLKELPNVFFLGEKSLEIISTYMQHFDINTMAYKADENLWASSGYPLKLHEYLAVGKTVISADIDAVREYTDLVTIPESYQGWLMAIERQLKQGESTELVQQRQKVASENTWDKRVDVIMECIKLD